LTLRGEAAYSPRIDQLPTPEETRTAHAQPQNSRHLFRNIARGRSEHASANWSHRNLHWLRPLPRLQELQVLQALCERRREMRRVQVNLPETAFAKSLAAD